MNAAQQKLLKQVTTYQYFVSYFYHGGAGMIQLTCRLPMRSMDDVTEAVKEIKRFGKIKGDVVILNWILL